MSITRIECISQSQLRQNLAALVVRAIGEHGAVDVLVPQAFQVDAIKAKLAACAPLGARVLSVSHWLEDQWELWGDGSALAGDAERHLLLRPILRTVAGMEPSSAYVDAFCSFAQDALAAEGTPQEESLAQALEEYLAALEARGLREPATVQFELAAAAAGRALVIVEPDESHAVWRLLIERLGQSAELTVLQRQLPCAAAQRGGECFGDDELGALRGQLFTGAGGLEPRGAFAAAEVLGTHAEAEAVLRLVRRWLDAGAQPGEVGIVMPQARHACPAVVQQLADAGISVECRFSLPLRQTGFGAAFLQLELLLGDEEDGFANTAAFIASPYSGLDGRDARAFASVWRSQAGSTRERRFEDLLNGIKGRAGSKVWGAKLARLRTLLREPSVLGRVRLMLENARDLAFDANRMADDEAAAGALSAYLELCERLGQEPCAADAGELAVPLVRAAGEGPALRIAGAQQLRSLEGVRYLLLARLDKDSYPMATAPAPFDGYLERMGAPVLPQTALRNRVLLLDALETPSAGFACYRLAANADGDPNCQSALWDELMTSYRRPGEEGAEPQELAAALWEAGLGLCVCEDEVFAQGAAPSPGQRSVRRGELDAQHLDLLFPDEESFNETFSPTAIEDYYRCPYRWFICRRVGAYSPDKPFDQSAKGNLAHAVFERFYLLMAERGMKRVTPELLPACLALADEAFEWQRQHEIDRHRLNLMDRRDWEESEIVRQQVKELVERDAYFLPGFAPTFLELKLEGAEGGSLSYAGVALRGKVDRIDVDEQGRAVIIDYKLSGLSAGYGLSDQGLPTRIQTDIYASLVQRCLREQGVEVQVVGSVYRSYAKNMLRGVYQEGIDWGPVECVRQDKDAVPGGCLSQSYGEYLEAVEAEVARLMEQMRGGDIEPRPLCGDACEYCLAESFCPQVRR